MGVAGKDSSFFVSEDGSTWHEVDGIFKMSFTPAPGLADVSVMGEESGDYGGARQKMQTHEEWGFSCSGAYEDESNGQGTIRRAFNSDVGVYVKMGAAPEHATANPVSLCYVSKHRIKSSAMSGATAFSAVFVGAGDGSAEKVDGTGLIISDILAGAVVDDGGNKGHIFSTNDGGATWSDLGQVNSAWKILCIENCGGTLLAGCASGHIHKSTNGGTSWSDLGQIGTLTSVNSILYLGTGEDCLCCGNGSPGLVYSSDDFFSTYASEGNLDGQGNLYGLTDLGSGIILCGTATDGYIHRSTDSGDTWAREYGWGTSAHDFISFGSGVATCLGGGWDWMARTTDSGDNWTLSDRPFSEGEIKCGCLVSDGVGLLATSDNGKIAKTENSGTSWTVKQTLGSNNTVNALFSAGGGIALVGVNDGHIWRSTTGGDSWTDLGTVQSATLISCFCEVG